MSERRVVIVGAGLAGLAAGCYARMNGYRATIFESHDKPGGLCTAWQREDYTIDACIHWLVGSRPGTSFYRIWEELGAVQGREFRYADEYMRYEARDGRIFSLFADIDRLEQHMLELAPEDSGLIRRFCAAARGFLQLDMPVGKPYELLTVTEKARFALTVAKYLPILRWNRKTMNEVMAQFKSPLLRNAILQAWPRSFPSGFLLTTMSYLHRQAAGYPVGGSLEFSRAIERRFLALGGQVRYKSPVTGILTEDNRAVGVRLADATEVRADYVICAGDAHAAIFELLDGRYVDAAIRGWFDKLTPYPSIVFVGLGVNRRFDEIPALVSSLRVELPEPIRVADRDRTTIGLHVFNHDPTLAPPGKTAIVSAFASDLKWWQDLRSDPARYAEAKARVAEQVVRALDRRFPGAAAQVEMQDVATPVSFVRYTGNWQGSVQGWSATPATWLRRFRRTLPGLRNLWLCGQWLVPIGGLPPAANSGRETVQLICHQDRRPFTTSKP